MLAKVYVVLLSLSSISISVEPPLHPMHFALIPPQFDPVYFRVTNCFLK